MVRFLMTILVIFAMCVTWAQDTYYYCGGEKVYLNEIGLKSRSTVDAYTNSRGDYLETTGSMYVKLKCLDDIHLLEKVADMYNMVIAEQNKYLPLWFVLRQNDRQLSILKIVNDVYMSGNFDECYPDLTIDGAEISYDPLGITGVAPDAKLMSVSDNLGLGLEADFSHARGIMWAWQNGADIISCSWKCYNIDGIVSEAITEALINGRNGKGCIVIKSAGNDAGYITDPGNVPGVIAVGNIKPNGEIDSMSCYGSNLLVCAPGKNILSLKQGNDTITWSGTSAAAPFVSGIVALMLERNSELTVQQVREILAKTAIRLPTMPVGIKDEYGVWDDHHGYGLVNAYGAVLEAIKYKQQ